MDNLVLVLDQSTLLRYLLGPVEQTSLPKARDIRYNYMIHCHEQVTVESQGRPEPPCLQKLITSKTNNAENSSKLLFNWSTFT